MRRSAPAALGALFLSCASPQPHMTTQPPTKPPAAAPGAKTAATASPAPDDDPYLWLEEVTGERALAWVRAQNERSGQELATAEHAALKQRLLGIYDAKERIPYVAKRGRWLYNFWRDDKNVRGIWRRTTLAEYRKKAPRWQTLLDVDALAEAEGESWVYKGSTCVRPRFDRCLVFLSRGGGDAIVTREFDTEARAFVTGSDGFALPEAKARVSWKDRDTLFVATDFGPGSLTTSGYPRIVKEWKRGTPLAEAKTIFEGQATDISVGAGRDWHQGHHLDVVNRAITFYESETFLLEEGGPPRKLDKPNDAIASFFYADGRDFLLLQLRSAFTVGGRTWPAGALLATDLATFRAGERAFEMLYEPGKTHSLADYGGTKTALLLNVLEDVRGQIRIVTREDGRWATRALELPGIGNYGASPLDDEEDDRYWLGAEGFLEPSRLELGDLRTGKRVRLKEGPAFFRADGLETKQFFAVSKDGTRVPYFQVGKKDLPLDGSHPVLLTGYGGFEVSLSPYYDPSVGAAWLEAGGVFVLANIRGGGEYGPAWHQAGVKQNRQRVYEDFVAVAEDLVARKVTRPARLGIEGGSNGGLLMGVMLTQRPDLFGAIVCSVPLLDMKRYHKLLAGASWMGEYGDPDKPDEWEVIAAYSPYQNVKPGAKYPRVLFTTSTRDDRVHPGHARKMVARMLEQGHDVLYYENMEGGHAGASDNPQRAHLNALEYVYLKNALMK